jgi:AraC-like DNA-binding protein
MTHQLNIFLLLFGALQGGLLSLWMLRNQQKKLANIYFSLFLIAIGLQLTLKVITKVWLMDHVSLLYSFSYSFPYLIGPLLYLYVKARKDKIFRRRDLFHFIPYLCSIVGIFLAVTFWFYAFDFRAYTTAALQIISLLIYGYLSFRISSLELRQFILMVILSEVIIAVTLAVMQVYYPNFPDVRLLFLVLTFLIYWISYKAISKPDLFIEVESAPLVSLELAKNNKYAHSSLKPEEAVRIENALHQVMVIDKLFLDSDLTIDLLASKLNTSRHHLSQVLNERIKKTYGDFVTDLRLEEARSRLSNRMNYRFTIAAIALDSGFNSVSSFNDVFKKRFGITPSKFRDQHLNKMSA